MFLEESQLDVLRSFDVTHHFADQVRPAALDEMIRVCKPGAEILIADLNSHGMNAVRSVYDWRDGRTRRTVTVCAK